MARLYADEDVPLTLVDLLRQLGHDVLTVQEAGRSGEPDAQVLSDATADQRTVLTFNRWDFERLHRRGFSHTGIISGTPDDDLNALAARTHQALAVNAPLAGKHIRVNRPALP
jgi:Domain of unknown function (DUF5615)